ncbi:hypothetical protein B296_00046398 [Ensete ventricosum]|uniref:Transmembrane protein n=1 Tax=Ensete ventricosum TaxID=4639 RepID=A0A426Z3Y7_ENSVE|nr:hypothetical protein B296_00046398 [Ensete ventricosum]
MVTRLTIVEFCRWVAGGGSLAFLRHQFFSSSKSRLTVLSAFLLFLLVVAASLFAISHLLPLSSSSTASPFSPPSSSSSSTNLLSWFFFSPSSSNNSSTSTPPPPPREKEKQQEDVVVDPLLVNRSGAVSESTYGGHGGGGADSSSMQGPLSGKESDQGGWESAFPAHAENFTKNNTLAISTDRSTGEETSGEVTGKSFASESKPPNGTSSVALKSSGKETSGEVVIGKSFASESKPPNMTSSMATKSSGNETSGAAVTPKSFASESKPPNMTSSCVGTEKQILGMLRGLFSEGLDVRCPAHLTRRPYAPLITYLEGSWGCSTNIPWAHPKKGVGSSSGEVARKSSLGVRDRFLNRCRYHIRVYTEVDAPLCGKGGFFPPRVKARFDLLVRASVPTNRWNNTCRSIPVYRHTIRWDEAAKRQRRYNVAVTKRQCHDFVSPTWFRPVYVGLSEVETSSSEEVV